jgi:hypothetical protein
MNWCKTHPTYSAKREPNSICGACWRLYFYKNPEAKEVLKRTYQEAAELGTPLD